MRDAERFVYVCTHIFFCAQREKKRELASVHVHVYSGKKKREGSVEADQ